MPNGLFVATRGEIVTAPSATMYMSTPVCASVSSPSFRDGMSSSGWSTSDSPGMHVRMRANVARTSASLPSPPNAVLSEGTSSNNSFAKPISSSPSTFRDVGVANDACAAVYARIAAASSSTSARSSLTDSLDATSDAALMASATIAAPTFFVAISAASSRARTSSRCVSTSSSLRDAHVASCSFDDGVYALMRSSDASAARRSVWVDRSRSRSTADATAASSSSFLRWTASSPTPCASWASRSAVCRRWRSMSSRCAMASSRFSSSACEFSAASSAASDAAFWISASTRPSAVRSRHRSATFSRSSS